MRSLTSALAAVAAVSQAAATCRRWTTRTSRSDLAGAAPRARGKMRYDRERNAVYLCAEPHTRLTGLARCSLDPPVASFACETKRWFGFDGSVGARELQRRSPLVPT